MSGTHMAPDHRHVFDSEKGGFFPTHDGHICMFCAVKGCLASTYANDDIDIRFFFDEEAWKFYVSTAAHSEQDRRRA